MIPKLEKEFTLRPHLRGAEGDEDSFSNSGIPNKTKRRFLLTSLQVDNHFLIKSTNMRMQ